MKLFYVWKLVIASERVCPSLKMEPVTIFCHKNIEKLAKAQDYSYRAIIALKNMAIK